MTFPVSAASFTLAWPNSIDSTHLQRLLDAAEEAINFHSGVLYAVTSGDEQGQVTEIITPKLYAGPLLMLGRRAESIESVIEGETTLAADDYELRSGGLILRRLDTGTNAAGYWRDRVYVAYVPLSDVALREMAQINLAKLDISFTPGLLSQTIGSWAETIAAGKPYPEQRQDILATLNAQPVGVW